jgi:DtxR family transcriptional regulator, Mn-dependent transcriptional regulator
VLGDEAVILCVPDSDPALLRYLAELGLFPKRHITMVERAPFGGPLTVEVDGARHVIGVELAERIAVTA